MTRLFNKPVFPFFLLGCLLVGNFVSNASAEEFLADRFAAEVESVGVVEKLNAQIPLDTPFRDENGTHIHIGDLFNKERPVILSLNYSSCPMLCKLQLNGLVKALNKIDGWKAGEEFQVVSVSIDPNETVTQAKGTEAKYLELYEREDASKGWNFLVGKQSSIRKLANAVGFGYQYRPELREYAHEAAIILCTPEGKVSRYLYGVEYPTQTVKLSLLEASEGQIGTTVEHAILYCFQYDPKSGTYAAAAYKIMKASGVVIMIALGCLLFPFWFSRSKKQENPSVSLSKTQITETKLTS